MDFPSVIYESCLVFSPCFQSLAVWLRLQHLRHPILSLTPLFAFSSLHHNLLPTLLVPDNPQVSVSNYSFLLDCAKKLNQDRKGVGHCKASAGVPVYSPFSPIAFTRPCSTAVTGICAGKHLISSTAGLPRGWHYFVVWIFVCLLVVFVGSSRN